MNNLPRQKLCMLVSQQGQDIYKDKKRCKAFLLDYCGEYQREIFVLTKAIDQKIPKQLLAHNRRESKLPLPALVSCLTDKLQNCYAFTDTAALWAVKSWGLALSVISKPESIIDISFLPAGKRKYYKLLFFVLVGEVELVKNLIQAGVNIDIQDNAGRTPLIYAILANQRQVVKELVSAGARLDIVDNTGHSAFHWAIMLGELELVQLLLQAGADIDQPNKVGNRAWEIAANYNQQKIKEIIQRVKD